MAVSRYCQADIVQRHMADPCELHGTEEFLCFSLSCLLHRSWPMSANKRGFPVLGMCFLFEGKAATKEWWPLFKGAPPWPLAACSERIHTHRATLPTRALRHSSKSPGHRPEEGPTCSGKHLGEWVDLGCALEMNLPASSPHCTFTILHGDRGTQAGPPAFLYWLFLQQGDIHMGLLKAPLPSTQHPWWGAHGGSCSPSRFLPSSPSRAGWGMSFN